MWIRTDQISRYTLAEVRQSSMRLDESKQSHARKRCSRHLQKVSWSTEKMSRTGTLAREIEQETAKVGSEMRAGAGLLPAALLGWDGGKKDNKADILPSIS